LSERALIRHAAPPKRKIELFLDSGAFAAWNRGADLDIRSYAAYIKRNAPFIDVYAGVDVIPGVAGQPRPADAVAVAAKKSYENHQRMKDMGLHPIAVFHQGESFEWLEKYLADREPYIGIATRKDLPGDLSEYHRDWLDECMTIGTNSKGEPFTKYHGFGITKTAFLLRYPWYSCDSSTWSMAAGYGMVYVPRFVKGEPDFTYDPIRIIMSGKKQESWSSAQRQYGALSNMERALVREWIERCGKTVAETVHSPHARRHVCLRYFMEFAETIKKQPFKQRISRIHSATEHPKAHTFEHIRFIAASPAFDAFSSVMNACNSQVRLLSYWEMRDKPDEALHNYVTCGLLDPNYSMRKPKADWKVSHVTERSLQQHRRAKMHEQEGLE
jgi:hypothetical protein